MQGLPTLRGLRLKLEARCKPTVCETPSAIIAKHLRLSTHRPGRFLCRASLRDATDGASVCFAALDSSEAVIAYVKAQPQLHQLLGLTPSSDNGASDACPDGSSGDAERTSAEDVVVRELSGGRINYVWRVDGPNASIVLKYAPPFVRSIGPSFRLSQSRLLAEATAHAAAHAACPAHVPALLHHDPAANVLVSELLGQPPQQPRVKLIDALVLAASAAAGPEATVATALEEPPPAAGGGGVPAGPSSAAGATAAAAAAAAPPPHLARLAADLATLLSAYLLQNSRYELSYEQYDSAVRMLSGCSAEVVAANADVVFRDPWDAACARNRVPPGLEAEVDSLRTDSSVRTEVSRLLHVYLSSRETLIHNDLTTGNILVPAAAGDTHLLHGYQRGGDDSNGSGRSTSQGGGGGVSGGGGGSGSGGDSGSATHLIDWEFATYGPMAYDIGSLLGNLLLSYCAMCCGAHERQPISERLDGRRTTTAAATATAPAAAGDAGGPAAGAAPAAAAGGGGAAAGAAAAHRDWLLGWIVELWEGLEARLLSHRSADNGAAPGAEGGGCHGGGTGGRGAGLAACPAALGAAAAGGGSSAGCGGDASGAGSGACSEASGPSSPAFARQLLADSLGYAGCVMARLLWGMHHYPALERIACPDRRAACQRLALRISGALLRPEERRSRGWEEAGGGADGSGGVRRLVRDAARWAAEVETEARSRGGWGSWGGCGGFACAQRTWSLAVLQHGHAGHGSVWMRWRC